MRIFSLFLLVILSGCAARQTKNALVSGDYDHAIDRAIESLRRDKDRKGKQEFVYMLEEAFAKAKERDERNISLWEKEKNPANVEKIYNTYVQLESRQERIRPLLPLKLQNENRKAIFPFEDYSRELAKYKSALTDYLFQNSQKLLSYGNKRDARQAFDDLQHVNRLYPGYKNVSQKIDEAREKGTDYVSVYIKNDTGMMIPGRLENALLDFSTMGLNDKWTVYHSNRRPDIRYDFGIVVNFVQIAISPDQIKEREFKVEREIKDGKKKLVDRNGNVVRDSTGAIVMVDNIKTVRATVNEFRQFKACQVTAKIDYINFSDNQLLRTFPLSSEFIFENMYAVCRGDQRAVEDNYRPMFKNGPVPFPPHEQMVYDSGEDIKAKLKNIITSNRIRS